MTDNQNMNKTSMKHVQQQHFIQDIKKSEWNVSENLFSLEARLSQIIPLIFTNNH